MRVLQFGNIRPSECRRVERFQRIVFRAGPRVRSLALACLVALAPCLGAQAQLPAPAPATAVPPVAAAPAVSPEAARRALEILKDPQKRAQITSTLETIARVRPEEVAAAPVPVATPTPAAPAPPPTPDAGPLVPNSLGAEVLVGASGFLNQMYGRIIGAFSAIDSVPALWHWLSLTATDPFARGVLLDAAWRLILVLAVGLVAEWAIRSAVRRPIPIRHPIPVTPRALAGELILEQRCAGEHQPSLGLRHVDISAPALGALPAQRRH